jgi:hypothetical protein
MNIVYIGGGGGAVKALLNPAGQPLPGFFLDVFGYRGLWVGRFLLVLRDVRFFSRSLWPPGVFPKEKISLDKPRPAGAE